MNLLRNTLKLPIDICHDRQRKLLCKMALSCFCLIFLLSLHPLKAVADEVTNENSESETTTYQETVETSTDGNASLTVDKGTEATNHNYVTYTADTVSKNGYTSRIWKQHSIWKKKSSASRHGCGICVASMALKLSGVASTPNLVLKQAKRSVRRCQSLEPGQAVKILKKNHVAVKLVNTKSYSRKQCTAIMKDALDHNKMVMALVRGKPFSNNTHWVLLVGYDKKGRIVVANSSYGNQNCCKKTKKQYHLVNWKQIRKKVVRDSIKYSAFLIVD